MRYSSLAVGLATALALSACGKNVPPPAPVVAPAPVPAPAVPSGAPGADSAKGEPGKTGSDTIAITPAPQEPEKK
jgi:hypothetical protein